VAFEKRDATQVCTWAPPLPRRAFPITAHGTTTDNMPFAGGDNSTRYGYFVVDTSQWTLTQGQSTPPVQPGEKFQLWTSASGGFSKPPTFDNGTANGQLSRAGQAAADSLSLGGAVDLYIIDPLTLSPNRDGISGTAPLWTLKDPAVCTVAAVQQSASRSWYVFYAPQLADTDTISDGSDGIITLPMPYNPRWLGSIGHVAQLDYTYSLPGGPDQLTCFLQVEPDYRTDALNPGRIVTAHRGGSVIWEGTLTEPQPTPTGWQIACNGCGTYGSNFGAWWDLNAGAAGWTHLDAPVDYAIGRGLRWTNRGIGKPATIWEGPRQDPGSLTVTDYLNLLTTAGSLTWELRPPASASQFPPGPWELSVYPLPQDFSGNPVAAGSAAQVQTNVLSGDKWKRVDMLQASPRKPPDLYIVNTNPVGRTVKADINTIIVYYQSSGDVTATSTTPASSATYDTTFADQPSSVALHGRMEYYLDISNGGTFTRAQAQAIGANVLSRYIRANFTNSFTVQPGQLINVGGVPVDLGCNWGGYTCSVQVVNAAGGGEVGFAPVSFTIGLYEYADDTQTAYITPFQSALTDIGSVISSLYPGRFS
jgi:hypothetical protein